MTHHGPDHGVVRWPGRGSSGRHPRWDAIIHDVVPTVNQRSRVPMAGKQILETKGEEVDPLPRFP